MNKNKFAYLFFVLAALSGPLARSQSANRGFSLREAVLQAQENSVSALSAKTKRETRYWDWKSFRASYLPQLKLRATMPEYNYYVKKQGQNDGTFSFVSVKEVSGDLGLSLTQPLWFTGGSISLHSGLEGYRNLTGKRTNYSGSPVSINLKQPLFAYNPYKWERRIQPLVYDESQKQFLEEQELIALRTTQRFFSVLSVQRRMEINRLNVQNTDSLYKIAQGRYNLGKIAENELLQLELSLLNSKQNLEELGLELQASQFELETYVGVRGLDLTELVVPDRIPEFSVSEDLALEQARNNRSKQVEFRRRMLQAESKLHRVKSESRLQVNLSGRLGYNDAGRQMYDVYRDPARQEMVKVGLEIPLLDWGRAKAKVKSAEASRRLEEYSIRQEELSFDQEVRVAVRRLEMLRKQLVIAKKSMEIGEKRYFVARKRYLIGKITISDLNIALQEKDQKIVGYINSLRAYWMAHYNLRKLTLYDFENQTRIEL